MSLDRLTEAVRQLQANQIADALMIRAIIASHPDPDCLHAHWDAFYAKALSEFGLSKAAEPHRALVHQACADAATRWNLQIDEDTARR